MSKENLEAHVQYDEMTGAVAVDWTQLPPGTDLPQRPEFGLEGFAHAFGVDTDRYSPFGIDVYVGEPGYQWTLNQRTSIEILALDETVVGASGDARNDYVARNGTLPYVRFKTKASLEDALHYIKRLNLILHGYRDAQYQETEAIELP